MDYSPSGSSVHGIFQARILEWMAISFSNATQKTGVQSLSREDPLEKEMDTVQALSWLQTGAVRQKQKEKKPRAGG